MAEHPTNEELSGFVLGTLALESTDSVADHLEACPPCQETVANLDAHKDTLLQALRQAPPPPIDEPCRAAIEKAAAIAAQPVTGKPQEVAAASPAPSPADSLTAVISATASPGPAGANVVNGPTAAGLPPTREQFLGVLRAANIIDADHWAALEKLPAVAQAADGAALARALIEQHALTKFQATLLYQNKPKGLLLGEYVILDRIGAGGMGQVFKARHRRMDRIVAVKVLAKSALGSPEAVKRFQREAKAAARLTHPNIVIAHDAGQYEGTHFLVMEFVDGKDLAQLIQQDGPLAIDKAIDYIAQAARGLAYAHGEGVVHRDIKPANLLLDKKGVVKVLDMGLARFDDPLAGGGGVQEGLTHSGQVMGTIDYMAPEQAFDTRVAKAEADVYALGCTLYRLLMGQNVYGGETLVQKLMAHREKPIPSLVGARAEVPPALDELFRRMIAKRAEDRPSMTAVADELAKLQSSRHAPRM